MTSKNSFYNMLAAAIKGRIWGIALSCLGFFFAFPIYAALQANTIKYRLANNIIRAGSGPAVFARDVLGENNYLVMAGVLIIGIFLAFNSFSYLYNRSKTDLFHSLPVKREKLFAAEYLSGMAAFLIPYILFMLFAILVGAVNGLTDARGIGSALIMLFINLLGFMGIYNTAIAAIVLTGNIAVGLLGAGVFYLYGISMGLIIDSYESVFFKTYYNYGESIIAYLSPVSMYFKLADGVGSFTGIRHLNAGSIALYILLCVLSFVLALWLFKKRGSEAAGRSMAFKMSIRPISVLLMIPAALGGGLMFEEIAGGGSNIAYGWLIFGFLLCLLIGHFVIQAIIHQDFKAMFSNLFNLIIAGIPAAVIAAVFVFDLIGYDSYIPGDSGYKSAAISSNAMQGNVLYFDFGDGVDEDEYSGLDVYVDTLKYRIDNMTITDKELIRDFALAAIEDTQKAAAEKEEKGYDDYADFALATESESYSEVVIAYNMNDGRRICRSYRVKLREHMDLYDRLYANEDYKKIVCPMLTLNADEASDISYVGAAGDEGIRFSKEDMKSIVEAYQADVMEQSAEDLKNEIPYGYITKVVSFDDDGYNLNYETDRAYIYPSFKRSMAILEKYGARTDYYKNADSIDSVAINRYTELDENGNSETATYTDAGDIEKALQNAYPADLVWVEGALYDTENADITVYLKDKKANSDEYYSEIAFLEMK